MGFGDFFSDEIKKAFADRNIDLGKTLLIEIPDFDISYKKYWIIVAINKKYIAGVVINTDINKNIFWNDELKNMNILIKSDMYDFLKYDSFIDCSKIRKRPFQEVFTAIVNNPKIVVGNISDTLLKTIHITITNAKTISVKDKKDFGFL